MGFRKAGEHRSKAVTRWSQGAINIVVNSDKEGFAHSYQLAHGPSVCAMCLKVDDAAATLDRAEKLRDTPFRQAVGPGELEIPAVRGLGGSLLYFVDPQKRARPALGHRLQPPAKTPQGNGGAGLTAVDHVSQSMHYEEMLTWLLFYTSLLDVTKTPQLDVIDPGGIVRSQVVQTADGALRIVLNASQSQQTLSSRFLTDYSARACSTSPSPPTTSSRPSSGCAPTASSCCRSRRTTTTISRRAPISPPSGSTCCARTTSSTTATRPANISRPTPRSFEELFFFEIVERRGYKGFGAVNASIRLAAQARESKP